MYSLYEKHFCSEGFASGIFADERKSLVSEQKMIAENLNLWPNWAQKMIPQNDEIWAHFHDFSKKLRKNAKHRKVFQNLKLLIFRKKLSSSPPLRGHCYFLLRCCKMWCSAFSDKKVVLQPAIAGALSFCFQTLHTFLMSYDGQKNFFRIILLHMSETERNGNAQKKKKLSLSKLQTHVKNESIS